MPELSVILPVYRNATTIRAAVDSVLRQTFADFELIVVANGSDADTRAELRRCTDARLRVLSLDRADVAAAFNAGLEVARGAFVARMDADDLCLRRRFALQLAHLKARPRLGLVSSRVKFVSELDFAAGFARYVQWQNGLLRYTDIALQRFVESPLVNPTMMGRREVFTAAGGYRSGDFPEDYDLWLRLLDAGVIVEKLPQRLLVWRDHGRRLTRTDARYSERAFHELKAPFLAGFLRRREAGARPLYIWGAGKISRRYSPLLAAEGMNFAGFIDIDPRKIGRSVREVKVFGANILQDEIKNGRRPFVVSYVPGAAARGLIVAKLKEFGMREGKDFVAAA